MHLRVIRAETMSAALARVRLELGDEALILSTKRIQGGIEIAAATEPVEDMPDPLPPLAPAAALDPAREAALIWHGVPCGLHAGLAGDDLAEALAQTFRFQALPLGTTPLLLAGPPGAGKTLTIAKLAARLALDGQRPMVVTADGARAGAVEQLAAFTKLLDLDLTVAPHPATLAKAMARRDAARPVLIDAPGMDALDSAEHDMLVGLASAAGAAIALVLPANLDPHEAADIAEAHAAAGAAHLVATRLDRARRIGAVLAAGHHLAIAECGTGAGVADGLAPPDPQLLAARLLSAPTAGNPACA
jgi:flagellar biosynthesis protein FlhF